VVDLEKFTPVDFTKHKLAILVLATHYEGDPTDNAK
jgi:NADPH-ferrihemoprotein reductase